MYMPPRQQFPNNAIAWALLSQTIWLPLLAIDLHDRWQAQLREAQDIATAAAKAASSTVASAHTNPSQAPASQGRHASPPSSTGILLGSSSHGVNGLDGLSASLIESARGSSAMATPKTSGNQVLPSQDRSTNPASQAGSQRSANSSSSARFQAALASSRPAAIRFENPWSQTFNKAELLGGNLGLHDLNTTMPPLAMAERARWSGSSDPLAPLPSLWREPMRKALRNLSTTRNEKPQITAARVVHVPSLRVRQSTPVPLAVQSDGSVDILSKPDNPAVVDEIRRWSARQNPSGAPGVTAAVVHLEPIPEAQVLTPPTFRAVSGSTEPNQATSPRNTRTASASASEQAIAAPMAAPSPTPRAAASPSPIAAAPSAPVAVLTPPPPLPPAPAPADVAPSSQATTPALP